MIMSSVVQSVDADSLFELRPMVTLIPLTLLFTSETSDEACIEYEPFLLLRVLSLLFKIIEMFCCLSSRRERLSTKTVSKIATQSTLRWGIECLESGISLWKCSLNSREVKSSKLKVNMRFANGIAF